MKKKKKMFLTILMLLFAGCATNLFAPIPIEERQSEVILENLEKSKDELFDLSLEWLAKTFNDSKSVIEVTNKEKGLIIGKGSIITTGQIEIQQYSMSLLY